ncbi:MAG: hypothetical protein MOGDAGHF_00349 [Rhodocyclaceae bacterium]|nr:hypothetical protein [Rhodocyclaceae bacterium]
MVPFTVRGTAAIFKPMNLRHIAIILGLLVASTAAAAEEPGDQAPSLLDRYAANAQELVVRALSFVGVHYRRGGESPETGFDCSGLVRHVFRESLGLILPRTSRDISKVGETIHRDELQPGDLVFFNTLRRGFSHVGIYLGDHRFVHAPATGGEVRVEDMRQHYWSKRYNGARRIAEAESSMTWN